jgi:hypothetical protein
MSRRSRLNAIRQRTTTKERGASAPEKKTCPSGCSDARLCVFAPLSAILSRPKECRRYWLIDAPVA